VLLCRGILLLADSDPDRNGTKSQEDAELTPSFALHPKALLTWDVKGLLFAWRMFAMLREREVSIKQFDVESVFPDTTKYCTYLVWQVCGVREHGTPRHSQHGNTDA
jgi:hypothetical protein